MQVRPKFAGPPPEAGVSGKTMRAAVHTDSCRLDLVEEPLPEIDEDEALLKVMVVQFCGSDKHDLDHPPQRPQTPGHEFAGVIERIADGHGFSLGQRVAVMPGYRCGKCEGCRTGGRCEKGGVYGCRGVQHPPGAFAEYIKVKINCLHPIPDHLSLDVAAWADPVAVALHAIDLAGPVDGQNCVVLGAGSIGIVIAQILEHRRVSRIALADIVPSHLETAARLGDFECLLSDDPRRVTETLTVCEAPVWFELAGGKSPTLEIAIEAAPRRARLVLVSQRPEGAWINYQWVMGKELTLQGSAGYAPEDFVEAFDLLATGSIEVMPLVTSVFPLDHIQEALDAAYRPESIKVTVKPWG